MSDDEKYYAFRAKYGKGCPETAEEFRDFGHNYYISWPNRRTPHKSTNPIMRVLDWLHQRDDANPNVYLTLIRAYIYTPISVIMFLCIGINPLVGQIGVGVLFYSLIMNGSGIHEIYRHYRNKYFKLHDLPGPYGWGTLDKENYTFYRNIRNHFYG